MSAATTAAAIATVGCVVAVVLLVAAERAGAVRRRRLWKPLASAGFLLVPVVGGALGARAADPALARLIVAGLCLGAIGDLALMSDARRGFLAGLVAFLLGHLAYVGGFAAVVPIGAWTDGSMAIVVPMVVVVGAAVLVWLWPNLGGLRYPVILYLLVIAAMLIGGIAQSVHGDRAALDATSRGLATAGAAAFFASDLFVAREKFQGSDPWNRTIGLPVYYGAQLLMAWAIIPR